MNESLKLVPRRLRSAYVVALVCSSSNWHAGLRGESGALQGDGVCSSGGYRYR